MGLDGGTIVSRTDVIRGSSWRLAASNSGHTSTRGGQVSVSFDPQQQQQRALAEGARDLAQARWTACALTGEPLRVPIVACGLGRLYNRESVIEFLLAKESVFLEESDKWRYANQLQFRENFCHIRSIKDVFELHFFSGARGAEAAVVAPAPVPAVQAAAAAKEDERAAAAAVDVCVCVCPLTGAVAGGPQSFSALWRCGHVFSSRALDEVADGEGVACATCGTTTALDDIIPLNGSEAQVEALRSLCRKRKRKRKEVTTVALTSTAGATTTMSLSLRKEEGPREEETRNKEVKRVLRET